MPNDSPLGVRPADNDDHDLVRFCPRAKPASKNSATSRASNGFRQGPEATHPALGLSGRSNELSVAVGHQVDPEQFELAASARGKHPALANEAVVDCDSPCSCLTPPERALVVVEIPGQTVVMDSPEDEQRKSPRMSPLAFACIELCILVGAATAWGIGLLFGSTQQSALLSGAAIFVGINVIGWVRFARSTRHS
jgi:hypothetical protein